MAQQQSFTRPQILLLEPENLSHRCVLQALQTQDWGADVVDASAAECSSAAVDGHVLLVLLGLGQDQAESRSRLKSIQRAYPEAVVMGICPRMSYAERCALFDAGLDFLLEKPFFVEECTSAIRAVLRRRAFGPVAAWSDALNVKPLPRPTGKPRRGV